MVGDHAGRISFHTDNSGICKSNDKIQRSITDMGRPRNMLYEVERFQEVGQLLCVWVASVLHMNVEIAPNDNRTILQDEKLEDR
jgi:hypothetical protein